MAPPGFEHDRMGPSLYQNLDTCRARAALVCLVVDYVRYLHSDPAASTWWDGAVEQATAQEFLKVINNDRTWPLVSQVVAEFRQPA